MIPKLLGLTVLSMFCSFASADDHAPRTNEVDALRQQGSSIMAITPIFSQLVKFSFPKGFVPAFEDAKGGQYIQESVLEGESIRKWSQMITITGAKGLAANPNVTPARFAGNMAGGFKRACPDSYSATGLGEIKMGNHDAFVAVVSCGMVNPDGEPNSESMLLVVIKGEKDYYTIQWAERGVVVKTPIKFDNVKWIDRLKKLAPIKLCPIVPGESAPYPSCDSTVVATTAPLAARQSDALATAESRDASTAYIGTANFVVGRIARDCLSLVGRSQTPQAVFVGAWQQRNSKYLLASQKYMAVRLDEAGATGGAQKREAIMLELTTAVRRSAEATVKVWLDRPDKQDACKLAVALIESGAYDLSPTSPMYAELESLAAWSGQR